MPQGTAMSSLEWFPLYVSQFLNSRRLRRMDAKQIGIYILLICEEWEGGPLPDEDTELAFLGRCTPSDARTVLERCFTLTDAGWINPELEEIREEQEEKRSKYAEAGRRGGKAKAANRARDAVAMLKQPSTNRVEEKRLEESRVEEKEENRLVDSAEELVLEAQGPEPENVPTWMHRIWHEALGSNGRTLALTEDRKQKYRAMYDEQLKATPDPRLAWRAILAAVQKSEHHMSTRAYLMPESLLLNASRRDKWVEQTKETMEGGGNAATRRLKARQDELVEYLEGAT